MAVDNSSAVVRQIRTLFEAGAAGPLNDAELLDRFTAGGGEAAEWAFAALVERHGPMVLRVCRKVLGDPEDAKDAFQATFLVLARKAGAIRGRGSAGSWLYGVALRVSSDARKAAARRRAHERRGAAMTAIFAHEGDRDDLGPALYEEIGRMPEKYRVPIVLCYLEGLTHEAVAEQLRWPIGTVQGRLARARDLLRSRLIRRGLAPAAGALAASLGPASAPASVVPPALAQATVRAAIGFAAGQAVSAGTVSASAGTLAKGALVAMFLNKIKAAGVVGATGVVAAGLLGFAWGQPGPPGGPILLEVAASQVSRADPEPRTLDAGGEVGRVVWSADGTRLAAFDWLVSAGGLTGSEVVIWDAKTGEPTRLESPKDFHGGTAWAQRVALSPDFRVAAAVAKDDKGEGSRTRLYDLTAASERDLEPGDAEETALLFSPDGKTLVAGRSDGRVGLWEVGDRAKLTRTLEGLGGPVESMALSRDGSTLAAASGQEVRLWGLRDGKEIRAIRVEGSAAGSPHPVALSPDGQLLAVGSCRDQGGVFVDGVVPLYDVATGRHLRTLKGHETAVISVAFSTNGDGLASAGWDKTVRLWDAKTGESTQILACPDEVWAVAFSPDGKTLAAGGQANMLRLWTLKATVASTPSR